MSASNSSGSKPSDQVDLTKASPKKPEEPKKRKKDEGDAGEPKSKKPKKEKKPKKDKKDKKDKGRKSPVPQQLESKADAQDQQELQKPLKKKAVAGYGEIVRESIENGLCPSCWMSIQEIWHGAEFPNPIWVGRRLIDHRWRLELINRQSQVYCWACKTKLIWPVVPSEHPSGVVPAPDALTT